jgi:outer membrane cobalamin receptor
VGFTGSAALLSNGTTDSTSIQHSFTQASDTSTSRTSSTATTVSCETSVEASASVSAGFPDGVSASVSGTYGHTDGFMVETSTSFDQSSSQSAQASYEQATTKELSQDQTITDWVLATQLMIRNGNFYALGTATGGVGGLTQSFGGYDVVVLKNPQLLFP